MSGAGSRHLAVRPRVARELDRLVPAPQPKMVVSDNRSELTRSAILNWADQSRRMALHCAGQAHAESFMETFNGRLHTHRRHALQRDWPENACSSHVSKDGDQRGSLRREVDHDLRLKGASLEFFRDLPADLKRRAASGPNGAGVWNRDIASFVDRLVRNGDKVAGPGRRLQT